MVEIRDIKQALRGMMNGIVSHSMREKGANYKVNFGVELPRLQAFAEELRASSAKAGGLTAWRCNSGTSPYASAACWPEC